MRSKLINISIIYLALSVFLGVYGWFYAAFSPKHFVIEAAKYSTVLFFLYFAVGFSIFVVRNMEKAKHIFTSKLKLYLLLFLGFPSFFLLLSGFHYGALSKGLPSILTYLTSDSVSVEVTVTEKRLWGKKDRQEEISISGYKHGFPVSRTYYNSVEVGQKITITLLSSSLGDTIEFIAP